VQLQHRFTVPAPIDVAWETLNDVQRVGACFPGAAVTSVEGDEFKGTCKVKLGPISMQYSGSGKFLERDDERYRAVIEARGKDRRGNGTAAVTVTTALTPEGDDRTAVAVDTDLSITGKPAQFGRGVIQDVSNKLLGQFTDCLESQFGADQTVGAAAGDAAGAATTAAAEPAQPATETPLAAAETPGADTAGAAGEAIGTAAGAATASAGSAAGAATSSSGAASALDLGAAVLPVLAKRYAPYAVAALALLLVLWRVLRR
jgi:carbon monoxide dehydrogenase subunit G